MQWITVFQNVQAAALEVGSISGGLDPLNLLISLSLVVVLTIVSGVRKILDGQGTLTAIVLGVMVGTLGHWTWLLILLGFLVGGHWATRWRWDEKSARGLAESKDGMRHWQNVVANGGVPGMVAVAAFITGDWNGLFPVFACGVAVAASDTFASEFGCLDDRVRMITTGRRCPAGTNGGWSPTGQFAALIGALSIAGLSVVLGWWLQVGTIEGGATLLIVITGIGWLGCQIDSLFGALLENRGLIGKGHVNMIAISFGSLFAWLIFASIGW